MLSAAVEVLLDLEAACSLWHALPVKVNIWKLKLLNMLRVDTYYLLLHQAIEI